MDKKDWLETLVKKYSLPKDDKTDKRGNYNRHLKTKKSTFDQFKVYQKGLLNLTPCPIRD